MKKRWEASKDKNLLNSSLSIADGEVLVLLNRLGDVATDELANLLGLNLKTTQIRMRKLHAHGVVGFSPHQRMLLRAKGNTHTLWRIENKANSYLRQMGIGERVKKRKPSYKGGKSLWFWLHNRYATQCLIAYELALQKNFINEDEIKLTSGLSDSMKIIFNLEINGYHGVLKKGLEIVPDGVFGYQDTLYFLEMDCNSEVLFTSDLSKASIRKKVIGYYEIWRQKRYQEYGFKHMTVLFPVEAKCEKLRVARIKGLSKIFERSLEAHPTAIKYPPLFWVAPFPDVISNPLETVWQGVRERTETPFLAS